jgi:hypothetical protein
MLPIPMTDNFIFASHDEQIYRFYGAQKGAVQQISTDPDANSPSRLTPAVSGRRPDETFQLQQEPQAGGGHEHGLVSPQ